MELRPGKSFRWFKIDRFSKKLNYLFQNLVVFYVLRKHVINKLKVENDKKSNALLLSIDKKWQQYSWIWIEECLKG